MERLANKGEGLGGRSFWPLGNYLFCSNKGMICLDNAASVNKMMHLMLRIGSPSCVIEEHLKYGWYVERLTHQSLIRSFMEGDLSETSYEASLSMALNSLGTSQQAVIALAKDYLTMARQMRRHPNINAANLAIRLSKITPYRMEIEWYKACCDKSNEQRGYYDSFKQRGASKRESHVNMNRFKLAVFWDEVICMLDKKELPHDLHKRSEWVSESQLYKLLVEPLEIAEYYRSGMHLRKGHYISNGRERRYKIFDHWWTERVVTKKLGNRRIRYASSTQDTCFWARVEEAKEWLDKFRRQSDPNNPTFLRDRLDEFETYAMKLVDDKEVSTDVVAKNSSFSLWLKEWRAMKSHIFPFKSIN
ncbi:lipase-like PAD4 [Eucalyptus grandis]|uniref:lipase-like PAD4 n=1 Tax=Eucalyptus grandis TaxID=71139 RepID=UPI00192F0E6F|nr:lipase-like PAD4 [Eucalyptus grandis]